MKKHNSKGWAGKLNTLILYCQEAVGTCCLSSRVSQNKIPSNFASAHLFWDVRSWRRRRAYYLIFRCAYHILFCFRNFVSEWESLFSCCGLVMTTYSWQIIFKRNICNAVILKWWIFFFVDIRFVEIIILSPPGLVLVFISSRFTLPLLPILSPFKNGLKQSRKAVLDYRLVMKEKTLV